MATINDSSHSKTELLQILEIFPCMIFWLDAHEDGFIGCNNKFAEFIGLGSSDDIIGKEGFSFFEDKDVELIRNHKQEVVETKKPTIISESISNKKSGETVFDITLKPIFNDEDDVQLT